MDTICMSDIMILAQVVFQIFCSQGLLWIKCLSMKRGTIQSNIHRNLRKVNQVIYTPPPNCMPHRSHYTRFVCSDRQTGPNQYGLQTVHIVCIWSWLYPSVTDDQMDGCQDGQTGQNQYASSTSFCHLLLEGQQISACLLTGAFQLCM